MHHTWEGKVIKCLDCGSLILWVWMGAFFPFWWEVFEDGCLVFDICNMYIMAYVYGMFIK